VPDAPPDRTHVYYQYCVYGPEGPKRDELVVRCVRRGIDIETLHVDVPPDMPLFEGTPPSAKAPGARLRRSRFPCTPPDEATAGACRVDGPKRAAGC